LENEEAYSWLVNTLWPEAKYAEDSSRALVRALTRSIYLQQDHVRQFVETDQSADRFRAISELVGAGRIDDLRDELRSGRTSRQGELRDLNEDLEDLKTSITNLEQEYEDIGPVEGKSLDQLREDWSAWWDTAVSLGIERDPPTLDASDAGTVLDEAVKQLSTRRRGVSNRREDILEFLAAVRDHEEDPDLPDLDELKNELEDAQELQSELEQKLVSRPLNAESGRHRSERETKNWPPLLRLPVVTLKESVRSASKITQLKTPVLTLKSFRMPSRTQNRLRKTQMMV
jgi:hypothetical protein